MGDLPLQQRGDPPYMAPELFSSEGVHSYVSDLWSLGCLLFELRKGKLPFGDATAMNELVERIRTVDPITSSASEATATTTTTNVTSTAASNATNSTTSISPELADLIQWMLEKSPVHRCEW